MLCGFAPFTHENTAALFSMITRYVVACMHAHTLTPVYDHPVSRHTNTRTHAHTHTHTHTHTQTHTHVITRYGGAHIHIHTPALTHTVCSGTHTHTCTNTQTYTNHGLRIHINTKTCTHSHAHLCAYTCTHVCTRTLIDSHPHTNARALSLSLPAATTHFRPRTGTGYQMQQKTSSPNCSPLTRYL
jgi:hypothetical protein